MFVQCFGDCNSMKWNQVLQHVHREFGAMMAKLVTKIQEKLIKQSSSPNLIDLIIVEVKKHYIGFELCL